MAISMRRKMLIALQLFMAIQFALTTIIQSETILPRRRRESTTDTDKPNTEERIENSQIPSIGDLQSVNQQQITDTGKGPNEGTAQYNYHLNGPNMGINGDFHSKQPEEKPKNIGKRRPELFSISSDRESPGRALLRLRLKRYSNPFRKMQNFTTCACPQQNELAGQCPRDDGNHSPCFFSFTVIVGAADQIINFHSTPFIVVDSSGTIDGNKEREWGALVEFRLPAKPQFFEVYAHNLGPVFDASNGRTVHWSETLWPVDAWTIDLEDVVPYSSMEAPLLSMTQWEKPGRYDTQSNIGLEFSVQCQENFMGQRCDLKCKRNGFEQLQNAKLYGGANRLTTGQGNAGQLSHTTICESDLEEKRFFECSYQDVRHFQVGRCRFCEYGVINETICVHNPAQWKQEATDFERYRTFTIVLAVILGILLVILIVTCIFCWIFCRGRSSKVRRESAAMGTYTRGAGAPYNISENGFSTRLADPLTHPLLLNSNGVKHANGMGIGTDWMKPQHPPIAVQRGILVHPHQQPLPIAGSPHQMQGEMGPMATSSPNTSESDFRPSPFTPRREAQV